MTRLTPLPTLMTAAAIALSLWIDRGVLGVVVALFVLVVPFEKLFPRHRGQRIRRPQLCTDLAFAFVSPVLNVVGLAVAVVVGVISLAWIPGLLLRPVVGLVPPAAIPIVGLVLFDVTIYWVHRWSHEVPLFWRFHAIHHSTEHLDWISGFRTHPFDGALLAPPFVLLLAAGFSAEFSGALAVVQIVTGIFLHANVRWRLRPLHRVVITPEFHHWHHANEPDSIHTNYSIFLPFWDQVFGTYFMPRHRRPSVYGVSESIPHGIAPQLVHPFRSLPRSVGRFAFDPRSGPK
jgi:sterol desaturase/sphingolipid hydroxylase (fatty acid hydroxylase superfamily)